MTIWYDILFVVNSVSKNFQSEDIHIDDAIDQLKGLVSFFENYREKGFESALTSAKEIAIDMNIDPIFREKRVIRRTKHFEENNVDDNIRSPEKLFRVDIFFYGRSSDNFS